MFKTNEGNFDRILRVIVGAAMIIAWFIWPDLAYRNWLWVGLIPLATGLMGWCAIYAILGMSTCPMKKD